MVQKYKKNNMFVVCSGTKGIGKTWFSFVLSQSISALKSKVLLFDADGGVENVAFQLNLQSSDLYAKMLKNKITLNNALTCYTKGRFDMIYAQPQKNLLGSLPVGRCQILASDLKTLAQDYDAVVVDCSSSNQALKNIFIQSADSVIVLVSPNLNGNIEAYKELEHIKKIAPKANVFIVVNHALSYTEGEQIFKTLIKADEQFIKTFPKLLGVLRQDGRIRDCVANKTTLFERYPVCESLADISNFAKILMSGENK